MSQTWTWSAAGTASGLATRIARLDRFSRLLDIAFAIPGTRIRFGVDSLIGLIPVVGDWAGVALSSLVVIEAARIGVPTPLILRMVGNIVVEGVVGSIPLAGDAFDVFWRANRRNLKLLREQLERDGRLPRAS